MKQHRQRRAARWRASVEPAGQPGDVVVADEGLRQEAPRPSRRAGRRACASSNRLPSFERAPDRLPQLVLGDRVDAGLGDVAGVVAVDHLADEPDVRVPLAHPRQHPPPERRAARRRRRRAARRRRRGRTSASSPRRRGRRPRGRRGRARPARRAPRSRGSRTRRGPSAAGRRGTTPPRREPGPCSSTSPEPREAAADVVEDAVEQHPDAPRRGRRRSGAAGPASVPSRGSTREVVDGVVAVGLRTRRPARAPGRCSRAPPGAAASARAGAAAGPARAPSGSAVPLGPGEARAGTPATRSRAGSSRSPGQPSRRSPAGRARRVGRSVGHVDEAAVVALEGDGDVAGRTVAVLGHDQVGLAGPRGFLVRRQSSRCNSITMSASCSIELWSADPIGDEIVRAEHCGVVDLLDSPTLRSTTISSHSTSLAASMSRSASSSTVGDATQSLPARRVLPHRGAAELACPSPRRTHDASCRCSARTSLDPLPHLRPGPCRRWCCPDCAA